MRHNRRVMSDLIKYTVGDFIAKLLPFAMIPYITTRLGIIEFGRLSYFESILMIGVVLIGYSQSGSINRYCYRYGKNGLNDLVWIAFYITLIIYFLLCVALLMSGLDDAVFILIALSVSFIKANFDNFIYVQQCIKKPNNFIVANLSSGVISSLVTIVTFEIFDKVAPEYRIISLGAGNLVGLILALKYLNDEGYLSKHKIQKKRNANRLLFKYIVLFSFPTFIHQLFGLGKSAVDRIIVSDNYSSVDLGLYSTAYVYSSLVAFFLLSINKALVPHLSTNLRNGSVTWDKYNQYVKLSLLLVLVFSAVAYLVPDYIYFVFLKGEYADAILPLRLFSIAFLINITYLLVVNYLFYYGMNSQISLVSVMSSALHIMMVYLMTGYKVVYMPVALILSNAMQAVCLYVVFYRIGNRC